MDANPIPFWFGYGFVERVAEEIAKEAVSHFDRPPKSCLFPEPGTYYATPNLFDYVP